VTIRTTTISRSTALSSPPPLVFAVVNSPETAPLIDPACHEWRADIRPIAVGRPLIAIATHLFQQAFAAQAEALADYLDERSPHEPMPQL